MNRKIGETVDAETVERLLGYPSVPISEASCEGLPEIAAVLSGCATDAEIQAANRHLEQCALCREATLIVTDMTAKGEFAAPSRTVAHGDTVTSLKTRRRIPFSAVAAFAAGVMAVTIGFALFRVIGPPLSEVSSQMSVKGTGDRLTLAVKRGSAEFIFTSGDTLKTGDAVGLFYTAETDGYLAIFGMDAAKEVTLLYPAGGTKSAKIVPKENAPLPDGAAVQRGQGCEWVIGVFSNEALDTAPIAEELRAAPENRRTCRLKVEISGARQVRVLSIVR